jgi:hypothetical protein
LLHVARGYDLARGGVAAIEAEAASAQKHLPLLGRVASKSLLLSGGLPEAQRVVSANGQTIDDLVERSLEGRIAVRLDKVSAGRRIRERAINRVGIAGTAGYGRRAGSIN